MGAVLVLALFMGSVVFVGLATGLLGGPNAAQTAWCLQNYPAVLRVAGDLGYNKLDLEEADLGQLVEPQEGTPQGSAAWRKACPVAFDAR